MTHVLVVDDDDETRTVVHDVLEDSGYDVCVAPGGRVALDLLRVSLHPHVVLLDVLMRDGDGITLLEAVRDDTALASRHCYLVVTAVPLSRLTLADDIRRLLAAPVMSKPFELDALLDVVAIAAVRLKPDS